MHTLLPYDDLRISAMALIDELLVQQVIDCVQLLETLHETDKATLPFEHPMVKAWQGSELQLCEFGLTCIETFKKRNGETAAFTHSSSSLERHLDLAESGDMVMPPWFGNDLVHKEYQGLLRSMDPAVYEIIFPNVATCTPDNFRYPTEF